MDRHLPSCVKAQEGPLGGDASLDGQERRTPHFVDMVDVGKGREREWWTQVFKCIEGRIGIGGYAKERNKRCGSIDAGLHLSGGRQGGRSRAQRGPG